MKSPLARLVSRVLKKNKIPFNKEELDFQIQSHPSYPSLHAITGVLDHFNIESIAAKVPVEHDTLEQLPKYFIAQINSNQGDVLVFVEQAEKIHIIGSNGKKDSLPKDQFLELFTGVIVAVEKSENKAILFNKKKSLSVVNILLGFTIALFALSLFLFEASLYTVGYTVFTLLGIVFSISIIKQEYGMPTLIGDTFCTEGDEKKDCDAVLSSKGALILRGYKLSDISLIYFSSVLMVTFFYIITGKEPVLPYMFSMLALPVTLYSIYYQYRIIKKWCVLCLGIVSVLWIQSLIAFFVVNHFQKLTVNSLVVTSLIFSIIILAWIFIKPVIKDAIALRDEKITFLKFKNNYSLFESLLSKSKLLDTTIENIKEVVFGNQKSKLELLIVTNPLCGHCKSVHKMIHSVLERYGGIVKIRIRFNVNTNSKTGEALLLASRILELYDLKEDYLQAMNDIYGDISPKKWFKKWGHTINVKKYTAILEEEKNWCINNKINFTPEILINGKTYPKEYNREDLVFFIETLEEDSKSNITRNMKHVASL